MKHMLPKTMTALPNSEAWIEIADEKSVIRVKCPSCGEIFTKPLTDREFEDVEILYANGGHHPNGHVQDVFPEWTPEDRELFLMSHMCGRCWKQLMPPDEEEETTYFNREYLVHLREELDALKARLESDVKDASDFGGEIAALLDKDCVEDEPLTEDQFLLVENANELLSKYACEAPF